MADILKEFFSKLYPWHFHVAGAMLLVALALFLWFMIFGVRKFSQTVDSVIERDKEAQNLRNELADLKAAKETNEALALYLSHIVFGVKSFIDDLNDLSFIQNPEIKMTESYNLIQRTIDSLASDIKFHSGDHHRCCLWLLDSDETRLHPAFVSAGFPSNYSQSRTLHKDHSVAGRALRTGRAQNISNVTIDTDWSRNEDSRSNYNSLIAVPIENGVLTIDGVSPMNTESQYIAELYGAVIVGAMNSYYSAHIEYSSYAEVAANEENV
ncbi:hypothetical protein PAEVO_51800 [Paenibacillus sp. GM2FR]|uniref:GAF domain-containing protein n=1 Tax=Paenibacillus sp. GM2FR TaxID=2059268 RepID=UPI000C27007B|nr:GAF domain-containing protein [Paenibacillus sp. GM2FR]PJN50136.1 hypothetical protein PAEVO_51800 [Paenibacillus sp. GM2FR]